MSATGIICSPGRTHMMGPSSLSVGLCSFRLEKVPQGSVSWTHDRERSVSVNAKCHCIHLRQGLGSVHKHIGKIVFCMREVILEFCFLLSDKVAAFEL